jgi:hypothetical protein
MWQELGAHLRQLSRKPLQNMNCMIGLALINQEMTPKFTRVVSQAVTKFQKFWKWNDKRADVVEWQTHDK